MPSFFVAQYEGYNRCSLSTCIIRFHSICFHLENRFSFLILSDLDIDNAGISAISVQVGIAGVPNNLMAFLSALKNIS